MRFSDSLSEAHIQAALKEVVDPNTGKDLMISRSARNIRISGTDVACDVELCYPAKSQIEPIRKLVDERLRAIQGIG